MKREAPYGLILTAALAGCTAHVEKGLTADSDYFGTLQPFASEALYFVVTDRFVDGDKTNNHEAQGGTELGTFDRPILRDGEVIANIGYQGGDFRGILNNAAYIRDMGFTALWITPIVDNPDQAFSGGDAPGTAMFGDKGKTGYHGYWGVNFFAVDEHLESDGLSFAQFAAALRDDFDIELVLDVVANHGSPSFTMPEDQPKFGELYDRDGKLLADHQNHHPTALSDEEPLHDFFNRQPDIAQLSDFAHDNPDVLNYLVAAYLHWIDQGAAAFRIDTIKHMPHGFWKRFSDRIRAVRPDFFMFAESWSFDRNAIAQHTWTENGAISVLDFPGKQAMENVFAKGASYSELQDYLSLTDGLYQNPYELMTFYDNHDMPRMDADDNGFIDANNWLFTSRGIPVVYYGSEIGFQSGRGEHEGNRNYFGQQNVNRAADHPVHDALARVANLRKRSVALQRGLQVNLKFDNDQASFLRVYRHDGNAETALVMLNKSDTAATFTIAAALSDLAWHDGESGNPVSTSTVVVPSHSLRVLLANDIPVDRQLLERLAVLQAGKTRRSGRAAGLPDD